MQKNLTYIGLCSLGLCFGLQFGDHKLRIIQLNALSG